MPVLCFARTVDAVQRVEVETVRRKSRARLSVSRALARCGIAFYDMYFGQGDLASCAPSSAGPGVRVEVRIAEAQDLEVIANRRGQQTAQRIVCNQSLGSTCWVAECESTVVGYAWINQSVFEFLGESLRKLPVGTVCIHDMFVFPEHRGKKTLQQMLAEVFGRSSVAGLRSAVCVVDTANAPAIAAFRRVGIKFRRAPILKLPGLTPKMLGVRSMGGEKV